MYYLIEFCIEKNFKKLYRATGRTAVQEKMRKLVLEFQNSSAIQEFKFGRGNEVDTYYISFNDTSACVSTLDLIWYFYIFSDREVKNI